MLTSEAAVFSSQGFAMAFQQIPVPALAHGELLVKNEYVTLCRSDLNTFCGKRMEPVPTILGHEIVGRIAAIGGQEAFVDLRGVTLAVGDRISWAIFASDPNSELSRLGMPQKGEQLFKYGHQQLTAESTLHGGLSQYIVLKPNTPVLKLAPDLPNKVAALINCSVATVVGAVRLAGSLKHKQVLISGAGMLGAVACAMAKVYGASAVIAADIDDERLKLVGRYGADFTVKAQADLQLQLNELPLQKKSIDVVIELSGVVDSMEKTLEVLGVGGVAVWVGATYPERNVQMSAEKIVRKLISIKGLHNYNVDDFITAVEFMEAHHLRFPFAEMIHDGFTLQQVNEAFEYGLSNNPLRVGISIS